MKGASVLQKRASVHTALEKQSFLDLGCEGKCFAPCICSVAPAAQKKLVFEGHDGIEGEGTAVYWNGKIPINTHRTQNMFLLVSAHPFSDK